MLQKVVSTCIFFNSESDLGLNKIGVAIREHSKRETLFGPKVCCKVLRALQSIEYEGL